MKLKPTQEEASEAEHALEEIIHRFSDESRAPWKRGTPDPDPTWVPRRSTLRFSPLRRGGWIYSMDANDQQIVAYYVVPPDSEPLCRITAHGEARHNFHEMLRSQHLFPTRIPWDEWYDWRARYDLDDKMRKKVVW